MFHIVDFCGDEGDMDLFSKLERQHQRDLRTGPCDDDCEVTAPFIDHLPEETHGTDPSPLRFYSASEIDYQIREAMRQGF